jgi:hypothetical protein
MHRGPARAGGDDVFLFRILRPCESGGGDQDYQDFKQVIVDARLHFLPIIPSLIEHWGHEESSLPSYI